MLRHGQSAGEVNLANLWLQGQRSGGKLRIMLGKRGQSQGFLALDVPLPEEQADGFQFGFTVPNGAHALVPPSPKQRAAAASPLVCESARGQGGSPLTRRLPPSPPYSSPPAPMASSFPHAPSPVPPEWGLDEGVVSISADAYRRPGSSVSPMLAEALAGTLSLALTPTTTSRSPTPVGSLPATSPSHTPATLSTTSSPVQSTPGPDIESDSDEGGSQTRRPAPIPTPLPPPPPFSAPCAGSEEGELPHSPSLATLPLSPSAVHPQREIASNGVGSPMSPIVTGRLGSCKFSAFSPSEGQKIAIPPHKVRLEELRRVVATDRFKWLYRVREPRSIAILREISELEGMPAHPE